MLPIFIVHHNGSDLSKRQLNLLQYTTINWCSQVSQFDLVVYISFGTFQRPYLNTKEILHRIFIDIYWIFIEVYYSSLYKYIYKNVFRFNKGCTFIYLINAWNILCNLCLSGYDKINSRAIANKVWIFMNKNKILFARKSITWEWFDWYN